MPEVAERSGVRTLDNFIGGRWVHAARRRVLRRSQSRRRRRDRPNAAFDGRRRGCRGAGGRAGVSGLARHAGERPRAGALPVQGAARAALRGAGAHRDDRARQDARRGARQRPPRHRVRRGGVRRAVADAGRGARRHRGTASTATSCASRSASVAAIAPFNFPAMVPMWFLPFAIATGNTFVLKPSEQVPLSQRRMMDLLQQCDLPPGVVNLVNGGSEVVNAICDHPGIRAVSFVGSTPVAKHVYQRASHAGKRVQALGGAKNFVVVMPDADLDRSMGVISESFYGCAGERCLAGSMLVPVGDAHAEARDRLVEAARALKVGDGTQPGVTMGR